MRKLRIVTSIIALLPVSGVSVAAPVNIQVVAVNGKPLAGAVVSISVQGTPRPVPRGGYSVAQRNIQFDPQILIVPVGATVSFPNFDKVRHHVYSFSKAKKFEIKLFGRDESRSVTFDKPGAVALGCNIHDAMNGLIYVTDTPFTAATGADGRVSMNVPAGGSARIAVWHPSIRAAGNTLQQPVAIAAAGLTTTLQLRR